MHTVDAAETTRRMIEFFPPEKQEQARSVMSGVLRGVVSQVLLPRIGGGRIPAVEVMVVNRRIEELMRENKGEEIPDAIADGEFFDMQTMTQALIQRVLDGLVESEVAAAAAPNRHDFLIALERALKEKAVSEAPPEPQQTDAVHDGTRLRVVGEADAVA
jgi:twitching motility protein PilT